MRAEVPPSTYTTWPVMKEAAAESRKATSGETSSGLRSLAEGVSRVLAGEVPPNLLNPDAVVGISGGARMER